MMMKSGSDLVAALLIVLLLQQQAAVLVESFVVSTDPSSTSFRSRQCYYSTSLLYATLERFDRKKYGDQFQDSTHEDFINRYNTDRSEKQLMRQFQDESNKFRCYDKNKDGSMMIVEEDEKETTDKKKKNSNGVDYGVVDFLSNTGPVDKTPYQMKRMPPASSATTKKHHRKVEQQKNKSIATMNEEDDNDNNGTTTAKKKKNKKHITTLSKLRELQKRSQRENDRESDSTRLPALDRRNRRMNQQLSWRQEQQRRMMKHQQDQAARRRVYDALSYSSAVAAGISPPRNNNSVEHPPQQKGKSQQQAYYEPHYYDPRRVCLHQQRNDYVPSHHDDPPPAFLDPPPPPGRVNNAWTSKEARQRNERVGGVFQYKTHYPRYYSRRHHNDNNDSPYEQRGPPVYSGEKADYNWNIVREEEENTAATFHRVWDPEQKVQDTWEPNMGEKPIADDGVFDSDYYDDELEEGWKPHHHHPYYNTHEQDDPYRYDSFDSPAPPERSQYHYYDEEQDHDKKLDDLEKQVEELKAILSKTAPKEYSLFLNHHMIHQDQDDDPIMMEDSDDEVSATNYDGRYDEHEMRWLQRDLLQSNCVHDIKGPGPVKEEDWQDWHHQESNDEEKNELLEEEPGRMRGKQEPQDANKRSPGFTGFSGVDWSNGRMG